MTSKAEKDLARSKTLRSEVERRKILEKLKYTRKRNINSNAVDKAFKEIAESDYITWGDNVWKILTYASGYVFYEPIWHERSYVPRTNRIFYELLNPAKKYQANADLLRKVIEARKSRKSVVGWLLTGFKAKDDFTANLLDSDLDQLGLLLFTRLGELRGKFNEHFQTLKNKHPALLKEIKDGLLSKRAASINFIERLESRTNPDLYDIDSRQAFQLTQKMKGHLKNVDELSDMINLIEDAATSKEVVKNVKNVEDTATSKEVVKNVKNVEDTATLKEVVKNVEDTATSKKVVKNAMNVKNVENMALVPYERLTLPKLKKKIQEYFRTFDHLPAGLTEEDLLNRVLAKKKKFTGNTFEYILADEIENLSLYSAIVSINIKETVQETEKEKQEAVIQAMLNMQDKERIIPVTAMRATLLAYPEFHSRLYSAVKEAMSIVAESEDPGSYAGALKVVGEITLDQTDEILESVPDLITKIKKFGGKVVPTITRHSRKALDKFIKDNSLRLSEFADKMRSIGNLGLKGVALARDLAVKGAVTAGELALIGAGMAGAKAIELGYQGAATAGDLAVKGAAAAGDLAFKGAAEFLAATLSAKIPVMAVLIAGGAVANILYQNYVQRGKKLLGHTEGFTQKEHRDLIYDLGVKSLATDASLHINANVRKILKDRALRESVSGALIKALSYLKSAEISMYGIMEYTRLQKMTMEIRKCFVYGKCVKGQDTRNFFTAYVDFVNNVFKTFTKPAKPEPPKGVTLDQLDKNKAEFTKRYNAWKAEHFPEKNYLPLIEPPPSLLQLPAPPNKPPEQEDVVGDGERGDSVPMPVEPDVEAKGEPADILPDPGSGFTQYDPMGELNEFYKTYFHNPSRHMSGTKRKVPPTTCPTTAGPTPPTGQPTATPTGQPTKAPDISQPQLSIYKAIFDAIGRCLQVAPPENVNDRSSVDRFWKEAEVKAIQDGRFHNIIAAISAASAAWSQGVSLPRIVASLIAGGVISIINGVWTCMASKPVKKPKLVHPHCPPGGIPRGQPGSGTCPPHSGGLLPGSKQREIDPYREGTILSADIQVPEEEDIKVQAGEGRFNEKGEFTTEPVKPVTGDKNLRLVSNSTELDAINEQRMRESLTALGLLDLLALNQQNRPLPEQLRQSRTIYYGGPQSGFSDPLTNPFSKFVWKSKADRYYVKPTDSVNAFRRQVYRQKMINLGMNEIRQYPEAAKCIATKEAMEFPKLKEAVSAHEQEKLFRPSYYFPQSGITGLQNAHARYHKLPARAERLTTNMPVDKSCTHYGNRIDNYEKQNASVTIQDAEEVFPFQRSRRLQNGE